MTTDNFPGVDQPVPENQPLSEHPLEVAPNARSEPIAQVENYPADEQLLEGRYRGLELLGQGGFAAVYRAWDLHLSRPCAIKENQLPSPEAQRQFEREANLLAGLHHVNLPRVIDHFIIPGRGQYLVMDYVEGEDLHQRLQHHNRPFFDEAQALEWISSICDALIYLHNQIPPVIHRDIKPQNIILTASGQLYLVDFGIAKVFTPNLSTTIGARAVSPGYSPPEQYGQSTTDARSDLYALAATLYTLLSGDTPPDAVDIMSGTVAPPRPLWQVNPQVSKHVAEAVMRAMQPSRTQRFASVAEFKQALFRPPSPTTQAMQNELVYPVTTNTNEREAVDVRRPRQPSGSAEPKSASVRKISKRSFAPPTRPNNHTAPNPDPRMAWAMPLVALIGLTGLVGILVIAWLLLGNKPAAVTTPETTPEQGGSIQAPLIHPGLTPQGVRETDSTALPVEIEPTSATPTPDNTPIPKGMDSVASVLIPAGSFRMGLTDAEAEWHVSLCNRYGPCDRVDYEDAIPAHSVRLDAYRIDVHEVTNRQYQSCITAGACQPVDTSALSAPVSTEYSTAPEYADYPVVGVSWEDAAGYCEWVSKSLPTEAQWERAASGDGNWILPWGTPKGSDPLNMEQIFGGQSALANFCDSKCTYNWRDAEVDDGWEGPAPVMSYKPNFMGLFDLSGNVQEWVLDYYSADYYTQSPEDNPVNLTPAACPGRFENDCHLTRGGGWNNGLYHSTSRFRHFAYAGNVKPYRGFRCAATP